MRLNYAINVARKQCSLLDTETGLIAHNFGNLMHRDIAVLGLLHQIALGSAPQPILDFFRSQFIFRRPYQLAAASQYADPRSCRV